MTTNDATKTVMALDLGERRIGVAIANHIARIPRPLTTLVKDVNIYAEIKNLIDQHHVGSIVVGLPRNLQGSDTAQTEYVRSFVKQISDKIAIPVYWMDEALTSKQAEAELLKRKRPYSKGDIDALAACYILEDYISEHPQELVT